MSLTCSQFLEKVEKKKKAIFAMHGAGQQWKFYIDSEVNTLLKADKAKDEKLLLLTGTAKFEDKKYKFVVDGDKTEATKAMKAAYTAGKIKWEDTAIKIVNVAEEQAAATGGATTSQPTSTTAPQRPTTPPPTTAPQRPTTQPPVQTTTPKQPAAFQKAQPGIAQTGPTAARTRGFKQLLPRVNTVMGKIKEIEEVDKQKAAPFAGDIKQVLNSMHGADTPEMHDHVSSMLKTVEGPKLWQAHAQARTGKRRAALHEAMDSRFQVVDRATFVKGEAARVDAKINPGNEDKVFGTLVKRIAACEDSRDAQSLSRLEGLCYPYIQSVESNAASTPQDHERAKYVKTQLTHARLAQQALKYKALGDPATWDATKEAQAGELQAAYFFEEGSLHAKQGDYGAEALGGDGGVNGSWWIRQVDPADKEGKGSRKFIFKPTDAEGESVLGFTPGSLASREVMAKALNDELLAAAGFDVGVCPTTLAEIDSAKLPDPKGKTAPQPTRLGSMQQLAASEGTALDLLLAGKTEAFQKIPKDNMDQIAVFDIITGAVDRHRGNLMVGDGPGGTKKFVPIDHGLTMPSKQALYLNRRRVIQNHVLLDPEFDPNNHRNEPLSPAVKEGILRLKPAEITAKMKTARDGMRAAHADLKDDMPDENLQVMQRSIEFLQKACQKDFSMGDLLAITSKYGVDIQEAKPAELDALLGRIAKEWPRHKAALGQLKDKFPGAVTGGLADDRYGEALVDLGWCNDLGTNDAQVWAVENAALAIKIINGKIVNPGLKQQIDAMIKQLGGPDKVKALDIDLDAKPAKLFDRLKDTVSKVSLCALIGPNAVPTTHINNLVKDLDTKKLQDQFDALGGDSEWKKIKAVFPVEDSVSESQAKKVKVGQLEGKLRLHNQIETLRAWPAFKTEGGPDEYFRLVGMFDYRDQNVTVPAALDRLRGMKEQQKALQAVGTLDDKGLIQSTLQQAQTAVGQVPRAAAVQVFTKQVQDLTTELNGNNPDFDKLVAAAVKLRDEAEAAVPIYAAWDKKLAVFKQAVSLLTAKKHPKATELEAALSDANQAFDEGRAADGQTSCEQVDQLLKEAMGGRK